MSVDLKTCTICKRQVLDNGQCLYCTTNEALDLRELIPDHLLQPPPPEKFRKLIQSTSGESYNLDSPRLRIGRDVKCQIVMDDLYVSRHHAFITYEDGNFWIEDLGSKN